MLNKKYNVLLIGERSNILTIYNNILESFLKKDIIVNKYLLSLYKWYYPNDVDVNNSDSYYLPRPSGKKTSWWKTEDIKNEFLKSEKILKDYLTGLCEKHKISFVLIADDTDLIERLIVNHFNKLFIPVILIEHGPGFAFDKVTKNMKSDSTEIIFFVKKIIKSIIFYNYFKKNKIINTDYSFGFSGHYDLICVQSTYTKKVHEKYGLKNSNIVATGNPIYDDILKQRRKCKVQNDNFKSVLIVSTGKSLFTLDDGFYGYLIKFCKIFKDKFKIYVRLKPGDINTFKKLENIKNISFDDNSIKSSLAIKKYDIIIGDSLTLLLEAIIMKKAVFLFNYKKTVGYLFITKSLGIIGIDLIRTSEKKMKQIFSEKEIKKNIHKVQKKMEKNQKKIFYSLDGNSSDLICDEIVKCIINKESK